MQKEEYSGKITNSSKLHYRSTIYISAIRVCRNFLEERRAIGEVLLMIWPPQSFIELLWDELHKKEKIRQPQNVLGILAESLAKILVKLSGKMFRQSTQNLRSGDTGQKRTYR